MTIIGRLIMVCVEIVTGILIVHGVMGFEFERTQKRKTVFACGIAISAILFIALEKTPLGLMLGMYWIDVMIPIVALMGRKTVGHSFMAVMAIENIEAFIYTPAFMMFLGNRDVVNAMTKGIVTGFCIAFCVAMIATAALHKKREYINRIILKESQKFYFCLGLLLILTNRKFGEVSFVAPEYFNAAAKDDFLVATVLLLLTLALALCLMLLREKKELKKLNYFNKKCIVEQTEQYKLLNNAQQELRKFHHDSKAHLSAIQYLAQAGEVEKIKDYVSKLSGTQEAAKYIDTGNIIGDAIINQYYRICREAGMDAVVMGHFAESLNVDETDMCIILTNIISNAYEAAVKCVGEKILKVEITDYKENQFIRVTNSVEMDVGVKDGRLCIERSTKTDGEAHGYGIANAIEAAERCSGNIRWEKIKYKETDCILTEIRLNIE